MTNAPPATEGPEFSALLAARRWVIVMVTAISVIGFSLAIPVPLGQLPLAQRLVVIGMWLLTMCGIALSRWKTGLWLLTAGAFLLFLTGILGSQEWTTFDPYVAAFEFTLFAVSLTGRVVGACIVAAGALAFRFLSNDRSDVLAIGQLVISADMVRSVQLLLSGAFLVIAWSSMCTRARESDGLWSARARDIDASLRAQERVRVWRDTAIRIHETVLNDIRYVLGTRTPDIDRLRQGLGRRPRAGRFLSGAPRSLSQIVEESVIESGRDGRIQIDVPEVQMPGHVVPYLRSALIEVLRNVDRHAAGQEVAIEGTVSSGGIEIVCDLGSAYDARQAGAGIGTSIVLAEGIAAVGGHVSSTGSTVRIWVPAAGATGSGDSIGSDDVPIDRGRVVVSGILAATAAGAIPYPLALLGSGAGMQALAGAIVLGLAVAGVVAAVARRPVRDELVALASALAATVPVVLWLSQGPCVDGSDLAYSIAVAGFALVAVAVWGRGVGRLLAAIPWLVVATSFVVISPDVACSTIPLNALTASALAGLAMPIAAEISLRRSADIAVRARAQAQEQVQQAAQMEASVDLAQSLDSAVTAAWDLIRDVAHGVELDDARRRSLRRLESRIRSTIQVDPRASGAFALAAHEIIIGLADCEGAAKVLSIRDSSDMTPIPAPARRILQEFALRSSAEPRIQAFTIGGIDHLSLSGSRSAAESLGIRPPATLLMDGCRIEAHEDGGEHDERVSLILSRGVSDQGSRPSSRTAR